MSSLENTLLNMKITEDGWTPIEKYPIKEKYLDEFPSTSIINKNISNVNSLSLSGEKNSEYLTFQMNRFYDGIDLSDKLISICYKINNTEIGGSNAPINVSMNNSIIKFGWLLPEEISMRECQVTFIILIVGKEYEQDYILKTKPTQYSIQKGFECGQGIIKPDDNWFEQFFIEAELFIKEATKDFIYNYELLEKKPKINDIELIGEKSWEDLGLIPLTIAELDEILVI